MSAILSYLPLKNRRQCYGTKHGRVLLLLLFLFFSANLFGQEETGYDEVSVLFYVPRIGNTEIPALINNEEAWIPLKEVFDYLKIKNTLSSNLDSLSGFFIDPKSNYLIEKPHDRIVYKGKVFELAPTDLVQTETGLYLRSLVFCKVFGLDCQFSFRNLSFTLKTNIELPALREMQLKQMRKNLSQLKGEKEADTVLKRSFRFLHFGMADWSVTGMQQTSKPNYVRATLNLGATVAGGEASASLNYYSGRSYEPRKQFYRWRYVNNDFSIVKQVSLGNITTPTISSIFSPVNGIQITNTPTTYRKSFGSYRYTGTTEPEWMVELYVNNILVDYVKADASGFFAFEIPIVYGNSAIRLKFYSPWGEENTREENITIPFNFLPVHQLEYAVSAGIVRDESKGRFSKAGFNYGLSRRITFGAGAEYLSSVMQGKPIPFLNTSVRLMDGIILNGEYARGVRTKATLNYRLPSSLQLDLSYIKYDKEQTAIRYNYTEELKASLTVPIRLKNIRALSRFTYNKFVLPKFRYSNAEFLLSSAMAGISFNLRTYAQYSGSAKPYVYSNLSLSFQLPDGIRFSPQAQYQYDQKSFGMLKAEVEKRISDKGYLNLSYENNRYLHNSSLTLGFRYDLSFARTFFSASRGHNTTTTTQSATGSFVYESKARFAGANNQTSVGRGGFLVVPFLDLNCNGHWDSKEPRVNGLRLRVNGGRVERRRDGSLLITGLESYNSYLVELDKASFDNISWKIKNTMIRATVEPNQLKLIEVPVAVVGEVSGIVYLQNGKLRKGLSRILVNFYDSTSKFIAHTLTEGDGYFSYLGLAPGRYTAQIDSAQLHVLDLTAAPKSLSFTMTASEEGTIADGFEFILRPILEKPERTYATTAAKPENSGKSEESKRQPFVQNYLADGIGNIQQTVSKNKKPIVSDTTAVSNHPKTTKGEKHKIIVENKSQSTHTNKEQRATPSHFSSLSSKNRYSVKKPSYHPARKQQMKPKKQPLSKTKQELRLKQQRLDKKQQQVLEKMQQLLKEQKELIRKQRELIREIQQLRQQLRIKAEKAH